MLKHQIQLENGCGIYIAIAHSPTTIPTTGPDFDLWL